MIVKELTDKDVDIITALYQTDFSDGWNRQMLLSSFSSGRFKCLGAFKDDLLVGVVAFTLSLDFADIESVVTKLEFRRKGVADLLIKSALESIKQQNLSSVLLEVRAGNLPAINLYLKQGFNKISVRKGYYLDGEDAIILKKEL